MSIIQSSSTLEDLTPGWWPSLPHSIPLYENVVQDYATLYRTQPNVRVCVDFLSRNLAQLGLHLYSRSDKEGRRRHDDHPLAKLLERPLPVEYKVTRFRLIETLMGDLGVYYNAFWLKLREGGGPPTGLLRIPPEMVQVKGGLIPHHYIIDFGGSKGTQKVERTEIVHFRGYNSGDPLEGLSPLETLRRILAEEYAMGDYREHFWQNAARIGGIIERPAAAPQWSDQARSRFKKEFEALYSGSEGSGKTAILEEGMAWKPSSFTPQEAEYLAGRKLSREEVARVYHIPPTLIGIMESATYSNIESQQRALYTDVLGPAMQMISQEIELQLLSDFDNSQDLYLEFNIQEKLRGNFEEQTRSLQSAVGRPWMTANEARSLMNLPNVEEGDELITPLNVLVGGQANPRDSAPDEPSRTGPIPQPKEKKLRVYKAEDLELEKTHLLEWESLFKRTFERQQKTLLSKIGAMVGGDNFDPELLWDDDRWDEELAQDIFKLALKHLKAWAMLLATTLLLGVEEWEDIEKYLEDWALREAYASARRINAATKESIFEALRTGQDPKEAIKGIFSKLLLTSATTYAISRITLVKNKGSITSAKKRLTHKTWKVTSNNPRDSHIAQNGETVGIRETFSNGLRYPGDYRGGAAEVANCQCVLEYGYSRR